MNQGALFSDDPLLTHDEIERRKKANRREYRKEWIATRWKEKTANPDFKRRLYRQLCLYKYGFSLDMFDELVELQGGVCAACGSLPKATAQVKIPILNVDHDHNSPLDQPRVRGLLCAECNKAEGYLRTPENARKLADYMERTRTVNLVTDTTLKSPRPKKQAKTEARTAAHARMAERAALKRSKIE